MSQMKKRKVRWVSTYAIACLFGCLLAGAGYVHAEEQQGKKENKAMITKLDITRKMAVQETAPDPEAEYQQKDSSNTWESKKDELLEYLEKQSERYRIDLQASIDDTMRDINQDLRNQAEKKRYTENARMQEILDKKLAEIQEENQRYLHAMMEELQENQTAYIEELEQYANDFMNTQLEELTITHVEETSWQFQSIIGDFLLLYDDTEEDWGIASSSDAEITSGIFEIELSTPADAMMDFHHPDAPDMKISSMGFALKQAVKASDAGKDLANHIWIELPELELGWPEEEILVPELAWREFFDTGRLNEILDGLDSSYSNIEETAKSDLIKRMEETIEIQNREIEQLQAALDKIRIESNPQPIPGWEKRGIEESVTLPDFAMSGETTDQMEVNQEPSVVSTDTLNTEGIGKFYQEARNFPSPVIAVMFLILITGTWILSGIYHENKICRERIGRRDREVDQKPETGTLQ